MSEPLQKRIEELNQELSLLKAERDKLNAEAKEWAQKRAEIHKQIQALRSQAEEIKKKRNQTNEKVKQLKELRDHARKEQKEKRAQAYELKRKLAELVQKEPTKNMKEIKDEIDKLEWKIQTTPLTVHEEKPLIEKIAELELQLKIHKQIEAIKNNLAKLSMETKILENQARQCHEQILKLAQESQKLHQERIKLLEKIENLKKEANIALQNFLEKKQQAQLIHEKIEGIHSKKGELKEEIIKTEEERQAQMEQELKAKLEEKAKEKLKRGEKLSWEEFQILAEKGLIE